MKKQSNSLIKRDKLGRFIKGSISWTKIYGNPSVKGKNNPMKKKENREKISKVMMENKNALGKVFSEERKKKISLALIGKNLSKKHKEKLSQAKIRLYQEKGNIIGFQKEEKHYNWQGGLSREPYLLESNSKLKKQIRERDNFTCQECGWTEKKLGYKLRIHHIDYNKKNNNSNNLISLCKTCHLKTNFERQDWIKYFYNKLYESAKRNLD